jgi:hypothetical protein
MLVDYKKRWKKFLVAGVTMALVAGMGSTLPSAYAGGKIGTDNENQWISIGMGVRTSLNALEHGSANGGSWSNTFNVDNARIYINGKIHKYVGFEFNTECFSCNGPQGASAQISTDNANIGLLDAIGKFEFNQYVNLWVGRLLVTGARDELNGPFYAAMYESFKTPFNSADFRGTFGNGGAGKYGRDNGATFWGQVDPGFGHLQYSVGVYTGLQSCGGCAAVGAAPGGPGGPNQQNSVLWAGRITYNLLNPEKNPGYYTSNTYYGTAGDILAIAVGMNHQQNGAGSFAAPSDLTVFVSDLLFEKPLANDGGVLTVTGEFKQHFANYNQNVAFAANAVIPGECFCIFDGQSYQGAALFLIPNEIGIGRFQPYARYTSVQPNHSAQRNETEGGVNYIISGHNARISFFSQYGNLASLGSNYAPTATGDNNYAVKLALQIQY